MPTVFVAYPFSKFSEADYRGALSEVGDQYEVPLS
jgi:hypothetical protein